MSDSNNNKNSDVPVDLLDISMMNNTERETLICLIKEVRDLRSFINDNRRRARDRILKPSV